MKRSLLLCVLAPLWLVACRPADPSAQTDMGGDVADLTTAPAATATTIRDLNSPNNTIKPGTKVKVSGVVTSPLRWVDADTSAGYCYYRVHIV
ncbi:MAG TPA: hypothetical protein PK493_06635, partial [Pseudomonadota bacterium]|nr:hypothetical protein [Pseudomonadota bacterium]